MTGLWAVEVVLCRLLPSTVMTLEGCVGRNGADGAGALAAAVLAGLEAAAVVREATAGSLRFTRVKVLVVAACCAICAPVDFVETVEEDAVRE